MKKILFLLLAMLAYAHSPFESPKPKSFDTSVYDTKIGEENIQASKNSKIRCRYVCDKKVYKEQKISDAIEFYKKSRNYAPSMD